MFLRPLFADDDARVLAAFSSHPDMARQGSVTSLDRAREYVGRLHTDPFPEVVPLEVRW